MQHPPDLLGIGRTLGVIVAVVVGGRYLLRPVFRFVAKADAVEVSTATALLVVLGTAWVMELAGVSVISLSMGLTPLLVLPKAQWCSHDARGQVPLWGIA